VAMKVKDDVILPLKVFTRILQCFFLPQMIWNELLQKLKKRNWIIL
jgi:hypothetical protein